MKNEINETKGMSAYIKTLIVVIILVLFLSLVLYFVTGNENAEVKSLLIGAITVLLLSYWHIRTTIKISIKKPEMLKKFTITSYVIRYIIFFLVVFLAYKFADFNPIYIVFGMALYPIINLMFSLSLIKGNKE